MRVMHIIPSAFDYFDDIRSEVFALIDGLSKINIESEAITIEYGTLTRKTQNKTYSKAPSYKYVGNIKHNEIIKNMSNFDIIHLHCPSLGFLGKILKWKKENKNQRLVVSYYRDVPLLDFFSILIKIYNRFYLPKIFSIAEAVTFDTMRSFRNSKAKFYLKDIEKLVILAGASKDDLTKKTNEVKLINREEVLKGTILLYDYLIS